jgi:hypothetical protein
MPLPTKLREEMAARNEAAHLEAERDRVRDLYRTALTCLRWSALGIFLILWSAHTSSLTYGWIAFWGGLGIGNGGIIFTLLAAYRRGERRGDW